MRPTIAIDATPLLYRANGIGRCARSLITALLAADAKMSFRLFGRRLAGPSLSTRGFGTPTTHFRLPRKAESFIQRCGLVEMACPADLYHATDFYSPLQPDRAVATIHDVIFLTHPETMVDHARLARWVKGFARKCRAIITSSEYCKGEIAETLAIDPARIHVVYWGVDSEMFRPEPDEGALRDRLRRDVGINRSYFLAVSCSMERKNTPRLLRAYSRLLEQGTAYDLVVVWEPPPEIASMYQTPASQGRIHFTGRVSDPALRDLYCGATATLYPSLHEGFGLPVIEAMSCGSPVITSATSCLPEIGGDAAVYVDPQDEEAIARAMERFENRAVDVAMLKERGRSRAAEFSWERCASQTMNVYRAGLASEAPRARLSLGSRAIKWFRRPEQPTPRRQRVMICVPCLMVGGTEIHTAALASALSSGGFDVSVCCYYEHDPIMTAALRARRIEVDLLGLDRQTPGGRARRFLSLGQRLSACLRRRRPDIVHVQYMTPGMLPILMARMAGVSRVIATVHVTANHYGKKVWLPRHAAARLCDVFLCVSEVAEASFFGDSKLFSESEFISGRRHFTIHNCVDLAEIDAVSAKQPSGELEKRLGTRSAPVIGIVGRLDWFKGHDILLEAFAIVRRRFPDATLLCVGDGDLREFLKAETDRLGVRDHVIWAGRMPQPNAFRHIALMDVVAMPSRPGLEGFGLSAAESMAFGKPVVASDVDGLAEVVGNDGAGTLVPPCDVASLADALVRLLEDERARKTIGSAARRRVERLFSRDTFADRHLRLYRALIPVP